MQRTTWWGHALAQAICCQPLTAEAPIQVQAVHVGFVVDQVTLGLSTLVFSDYCSALIVSSNACAT